MLQVAFAGTFPASLEQSVRRHLTTPCEIVVATEAEILPRLSSVDVLVTMGLTAEMGRAATKLKLVQVPGAGIDRIDRSGLPDGALLANAYGHETGIAEYVIGAILALTRSSRGSMARCGEEIGTANGQSAPHRLRSGRNSPAGRSVSSALGGSVGTLPVSLTSSTCRFAQSDAMSGNR